MTEVTLQFDNKASESLEDLMKYYNVSTKAELVLKAIGILKIAAHVGKTDGQLIARKDGEETQIIVK